MNSKVDVSIVMPVYNSAKFLGDAIMGVIRQSYKNWELIIIDDNSTDESQEVIRQLSKDSRVKTVKNSENRGLVFSLNRGVKLAKGKYIARIDGDDLWIDIDKLKRQVSFLDKNLDYGMVGSWGVKIDESGNIIGKINFPYEDKKIRNYILIENCFIHSSVVVRKKMMQAMGLYSKKYNFAEDYALWLRIGTESRFYNIPSEMVAYRITHTGITRVRYRNQIECSIRLVNQFKNFYSNYYFGYFLWHLRKITPGVFKNMTAGIMRRV